MLMPIDATPLSGFTAYAMCWEGYVLAAHSVCAENELRALCGL